MTRDNNGRYLKGFCGNPKGRPRKPKRSFVDNQHRMDMLLAMEEEMAVPIAGKRRKMPIILFIYKQFLRKAASGDVRCMSKAIELRRQLIAERANQQLSLMQELLGAEKACAENPEDVTDKLIEAMRRAREALDDDYKLH